MGLEITRASGVYLYDKKGRKYLDFISGIGVSSVGHCHPDVITAVKAQLENHLHVMVYGEFIQQSQTDLAEKLTSLLPPSLSTIYFTNSGTEANEGALKLAKRHTGRGEIISFRGSYHGSTHGSLSVSDHETRKSAFRPLLPDIRFIRLNKVEDLRYITEKTACIIIEPIQGDAGVRSPEKKFMKSLRDKCSDSGALLVMDEIQTGFGRTGTLFAFEKFEVVPDILTLGKALGGGLPLGAFISSSDIMKQLTHQPPLGHITTFGGNPVCCAAGLASLNVIMDNQLLHHVEKKGALIEELLRHNVVREIRREGLMLAIDLPTEKMVEKLVTRCLQKGVLLFWFLSCRNSFRIAPPLTITEEEIKHACNIIREQLDMLETDP